MYLQISSVKWMSFCLGLNVLIPHRHKYEHKHSHTGWSDKSSKYRSPICDVPKAGNCCCCICLNTLRPRQNGRHFADDIFKCISWNENARISLKISLKFVPKVRINNIPSLVHIMAWRRPGDKPLSEPMMVSLLTHICVTRPQWVNT